MDNVRVIINHSLENEDNPASWFEFHPSKPICWIGAYFHTQVTIPVSRPSIVSYSLTGTRDIYHSRPTNIRNTLPIFKSAKFRPFIKQTKIPLQIYFGGSLEIIVTDWLTESEVAAGRRAHEVKFEFQISNWRARGCAASGIPVYNLGSPNATIRDEYDFSHLMIHGPASLKLNPINI